MSGFRDGTSMPMSRSQQHPRQQDEVAQTQVRMVVAAGATAVAVLLTWLLVGSALVPSGWALLPAAAVAMTVVGTACAVRDRRASALGRI